MLCTELMARGLCAGIVGAGLRGGAGPCTWPVCAGLCTRSGGGMLWLPAKDAVRGIDPEGELTCAPAWDGGPFVGSKGVVSCAW